MWNLSPQTVLPIVLPQPLCWWYHCHLFELPILFILLYNHYQHIVATVGPNLIGRCENTGILALHWSMYGYFLTVRTCKSTYNISGICTRTRHTFHTHTLHVTYTIYQHSLCMYFTRPIYTTRTRFTSILYVPTNYAPTYAHNKCQRITCTIYAPNFRVQPTSYFGAHTLRVQPTRPTYAYNLHLSLACAYYTMWFGAHVFIIRISNQ